MPAKITRYERLQKGRRKRIGFVIWREKDGVVGFLKKVKRSMQYEYYTEDIKESEIFFDRLEAFVEAKYKKGKVRIIWLCFDCVITKPPTYKLRETILPNEEQKALIANMFPKNLR